VARPRKLGAMRSPRHRALDDLGEMRTFVGVVEGQSFSAAARALGATTSAVSKRIAALEGKLGTQLFHRTTRTLATTEAGQVLYERVRRVLTELADAERDVVGLGEGLRGVVRVSAPVTFGQLHVAPLVADFLLDHREVRIELTLDDRYVNVVAEGFDLAIRAGRLVDSTLIARKLASDRRVVCGAPSYLERHGVPRTPAELASHDCMRHALHDASATWTFDGPHGRESVVVQSSLRLNHGGAIRAAVLRGLGLALLPGFTVDDDLRSGALRTVLDEYRLPPSGIYAVMPADAHATRKVRSLVDHVARALPSRLGAAAETRKRGR
jgi:DNA-binding transcriptional LysR family regulator